MNKRVSVADYVEYTRSVPFLRRRYNRLILIPTANWLKFEVVITRDWQWRERGNRTTLETQAIRLGNRGSEVVYLVKKEADNA